MTAIAQHSSGSVAKLNTCKGPSFVVLKLRSYGKRFDGQFPKALDTSYLLVFYFLRILMLESRHDAENFKTQKPTLGNCTNVMGPFLF